MSKDFDIIQVDLAETRAYLRRCAQVNKDVGAIGREDEFARYADAVDAAIRLLEKMKETHDDSSD